MLTMHKHQRKPYCISFKQKCDTVQLQCIFSVSLIYRFYTVSNNVYTVYSLHRKLSML